MQAWAINSKLVNTSVKFKENETDLQIFWLQFVIYKAVR